MRRYQEVALQIIDTKKRSAGISDLPAALGKECFENGRPALNQKMRTDRRCEHGRKNGKIGCVPAIGVGEESNSTRNKRRILRSCVLSEERDCDNQRDRASTAPNSEMQTMKIVTHGSMLREPRPARVKALSCDCQAFVILTGSLLHARTNCSGLAPRSHSCSTADSDDNKSLTIC